MGEALPLNGNIRAALQAMALENNVNAEGSVLLTRHAEDGRYHVAERHLHRVYPLLVGIVAPLHGSGNPTDYMRNGL